MPIRHRRRFCPNRARRILDMLDMSGAAFADQLNRMTGASASRQDVSTWLAGRRPLPDAAVLLLKAMVREIRWRRRRDTSP
jgi:hypothetical protein